MFYIFLNVSRTPAHRLPIALSVSPWHHAVLPNITYITLHVIAMVGCLLGCAENKLHFGCTIVRESEE